MASCVAYIKETKIKDRTGERFGRLVIIEFTGKDGWGKPKWKVRCDCGKQKNVSYSNLRSGQINSCGCLRRELVIAKNLKHGMAKTKTYRCWSAMINRCRNQSQDQWEMYGGSGIEVCRQWQDSFEFFLEDMGECPPGDFSIDRINNSKGYYKENCRWADRATQRRNQSSRLRLLELHGKTQCLTDWAREYGIHRETLATRLGSGWDLELALTTPPRVRPQV